ncbi:AT-rich interactive domain-containing protein 2 [Sesamum alatum]|uniref:AT-rich interactive domain-containing protein 2 n=1 Tax=Sesamum alatum TaxID=300844 RepID=A0AAE2CIY6_9LAMI|nr:AT-rich interactive domain-containing protein 2 [Sesamum alatum]
MGIKRPLEEEDFAEPSFKQPKQLDYNKKLTLNTEESRVTTLRVDSPGRAKSISCKSQYDRRLENGDIHSASLADKEWEPNAPLSLVASSSREDVVNGDTSVWSNFPGFIDFGLPRRLPQQFEDPYISLLNSRPRKEVPIGPDHQAEVPQWDPNASRDNDREEKLMGTCIISMPDANDSTIDEVRVGRGRTDCGCLDVGSMRCVQQHVTEAREKLRETIGDENFEELGLSNTGDVVACKWTPDEEQVFHEIVFSNPVSHGKKFWKHLRVAFPGRTKRELVSYYFNVFMLHRRAIQNRSYSLDIDSDDDEDQKGAHGDLDQNGSYSLDPDTDNDDDQQGPNGECYTVGREDEDSTVESIGDQDLDTSWVDDFWSEPEHVSRGEGSKPNHDTADSNFEKQDAVDIDDRTEKTSSQETNKLHDDHSFDS